MDIFSIDPGSEKSAFTHFRIDSEASTMLAVDCGKMANQNVFTLVRSLPNSIGIFAIEKVVSFGRAVGREVMDTAMFAGVFAGCYARWPVYMIPRAKIRFHLGNSRRAGDKEVRGAIIKRYPELKGRLTSDMWSAFAVGITAYDLSRMGGLEQYGHRFQ